MSDPSHDNGELPRKVAGGAQADALMALATVNKEIEERLLRVLDQLAGIPEIDKRWLAIGRTGIEQGFMAINRAVFKPGRLDLPAE